MPKKNRRVYLVQQIRWQRPREVYYLGEEATGQYTCSDPGEGSLVKAFHDLDRAEAFCRAQEQAARAARNPFHYGRTLEERSSFDQGRFHDWLLDAGLTPPRAVRKDSQPDWEDWWEANRKQMSDYQRTQVWEALDKIRFYTIVELEPPSE